MGFEPEGGGGGSSGPQAVTNIASASGTVNLNPLAVILSATMTGNCTFTFNPSGGLTSGFYYEFTAYLYQDGSGAHTLTFPGSVSWIGGTTPTPNISPNALNLYTFGTINGGTTWYGSLAQELPALPFSVPEGGTGQLSLGAFQVLAGGATSSSGIQSIASSGIAGEVLTDTGGSSAPTFQPLAGGPAGPSPAGYGLGLLTLNPMLVATDGASGAAVFLVVLATAAQNVNVTKLGCWVASAGVTPGAGTNTMALYSEAGVLIAQTGDMTAAFEATGFQEGTITSTALAAGTNYYLAVLTDFTGTTPYLYSYNASVIPPALNGHYPSLFIGSQTSMPASFTPSTAGANGQTYVMYAR